VAIGKKRVARLMGAAGLVGASRRRSIATTRRDPEHRPANDLVRRNFFVEKPNEVGRRRANFVKRELEPKLHAKRSIRKLNAGGP
jgi:putative transposase